MKKEQVDKMSLTEAVNYALSKLVEQGSTCKNYNYCIYGNDEGKHCIVGWLLDEDDKELMNYEGSVSSLSIEYEERLPKLIIDNVELFVYLQRLHDYNTPIMLEPHIDDVKKCVDIDQALLDKWLDIKEKESSYEG